MSAYQTVVVGTDGSDSSLRAVEKAGSIAGADAKLIVATAYLPQQEDARAADALKDESYKVSGSAPIYAILREAKERASAAGAQNIEERSIVGAPVDALVGLAEEVGADLLVVGNVGLSTIAGRLLGSVPANVSRRAKVDVLIVHTSVVVRPLGDRHREVRAMGIDRGRLGGRRRRIRRAARGSGPEPRTGRAHSERAGADR